MERNKLNKTIWKALTGVAGGALLGILFAPDKGSKTREKISHKSNDALKEISDNVKEIRKYISETTTKAKEGVEDVSQEVKEKGQEMGESVEDLMESVNDLASQTKEELSEKAKKAKIDGYSVMNKDELIDALKENILQK